MAEAQGNQEDGQDLVGRTLAYLARALVEFPDEVRVTSSPGDRRDRVYTLHVHPDDMGRIIGRGGRVARALRTVTRAAAARADISAAIEIAE